MKLTALVFALGLSIACFGQDRSGITDAEATAIVSSFKDKKLAEKDLVPPGFTKVAEARGDLNNDGVNDLALIIREKPSDKDESASERDQDKKAMSGEEKEEDSSPPQVVLLFLGDKSGTFTFWKLGPHHFLDAFPNFIDAGGIGDFKIQKGVLIINSSIGVSIGSWAAGGCTQKWRNDKGGFRLIGLTIVDSSRACACGDTKDVNYLTGDEIFTSNRTENRQEAKKMKTEKRKIEPRIILWDDFDYDSFCTMY